MDVPLPKARVSEVLGLLEILDDEHGRVDLYKLGRTVGHDIDELISTIETAQLFGLVDVDNGDVVFTDVGKQFTDEDMEERKHYISESLSKLPYMTQLLTALLQSDEHAVDMDFLKNVIDGDFSERETEYYIRNLLDWARFAELVWVDSDEQTIHLEVEEDNTEEQSDQQESD
ncbi:AAA-associated domain-containing protein [Coprothermobacter platensis]|uniref:AAA-associated domain-containing protein n=1 Tax=Coprothermobacter platensis TaxID=108819 RepID=UPI0012EA6F23|nr:AAA-associated domain-containing protein [Coprothermobacter platensis]